VSADPPIAGKPLPTRPRTIGTDTGTKAKTDKSFSIGDVIRAKPTPFPLQTTQSSAGPAPMRQPAFTAIPGFPAFAEIAFRRPPSPMSETEP
jgi:hypothetical protein